MATFKEGYGRDTLLKYSSIGLLISTNLAYGLLLPLCRIPDSKGNIFFGPSSVVMIEALKILVSTIGLILKHINQFRGVMDSNHYMSIPIMSDEEKLSKNITISDSSEALYESGGDIEQVDIEGRTNINPNFQGGYIYSFSKVFCLIWEDIWNPGALQLLAPSVLYVIQNNLQIFAAGYLAPAEFQAFSQLKLVTTALFSIWLLKKRLITQQWICIMVLCFGIIMVRGADSILGSSASRSKPEFFTFGVCPILTAACCSGLASVLTEIRLKGKESCFWSTNIQLSVFSLLPSLIPVVIDCFSRKHFDPLRYFNWLTWTVILINASGGILVSIVIKYADSILKGFAVSIALLLTIFASSLITGTQLTFFQIIGGLLVAASSFYYGQARNKEAE